MNGMPSVAIISTVHRPGPSFSTWLTYHLQRVDYILLFIDDLTKWNEFRSNDPRVILFAGSQQESQLEDQRKPMRHLVRQRINVHTALEYCLANDITWLLHIDDDELFFEGSQKEWPTWDFGQIRFINHEVVQSVFEVNDIFRDVEPLFKKNFAYNIHSGYRFLSYQNGKSAVRVSPNIATDWHPHWYARYEGKSISVGTPMILHYSGVTYERWVAKFKNLGNFSEYVNDQKSIHYDDRFYFKTRDIVLEAEKTGNWETARQWYFALFPHLESTRRPLLERGLLQTTSQLEVPLTPGGIRLPD